MSVRLGEGICVRKSEEMEEEEEVREEKKGRWMWFVEGVRRAVGRLRGWEMIEEAWRDG